MLKPGDCTSMAQIRAEIDRLDEDLVRLFAERAGYIDRAAEIKAEVDLPARINGRVEEVVGNVRRHLRAAARSGGKALAAADRLVHRPGREPVGAGQFAEGMT
jgi:chorismate mutase